MPRERVDAFGGDFLLPVSKRERPPKAARRVRAAQRLEGDGIKTRPADARGGGVEKMSGQFQAADFREGAPSDKPRVRAALPAAGKSLNHSKAMRPVLLAPLLSALALSASGAELSPEQRFQTEVWPLLENTCLRCHGPEKQKAGLRLDSREAALKGGESGPALVPGKPEESLLLQLVRHAEADRKMPPKEKLRDTEIASLGRWIAGGAPWPAPALAAESAPASGEKFGDAWSDPRNPIVKIFAGQRLNLWSLKPIRNPKSEIRNSIDAFVSTKPEADPRTLCRRLYFDLTGLPPTPDEMQSFCDSAIRNPQSAIESLADRLLASPRHGEHAARQWLDVVRYSDSNGYDWDEFRPQAWRYRDYVIRSLNADKPFDRFLREQLAGDELLAAAPRDAAEQDCLIATGFLRLGPHDNSAGAFLEVPRVRAALMNDLVETTGAAFLGLTLSCARCHHHKSDPISQADYYRLRAFFEGVKFRDDLPLDLAPEQDEIRRANEANDARLAEKRKARDAISDPLKDRLRTERLAKQSAEDQALIGIPEDKRDDAVKKKIAAIEKKITPSEDEVKAALSEDQKQRYNATDEEVQAIKKQTRAFTTGLLATDENATPPATRILFQGDITKPREPVAPGFLSALDPNPAPIAKPARENSAGRRSALAGWLVSPRNPLTARVIVNRLWQSYFGEGIVATPSDFGLAGARPTNPELLDFLAGEFVREDWSLKKLRRLIVTSAAYRQAGKPRRLTAEALRDAMLAVAGRLTPYEGGPPLWPALPEEVIQANPAILDDNAEKTKGWYPSPPEKLGVRSIFLVQKRGVHLPMMETFDQPDNALSCPCRTVSTVAPQALTLLNSPFATEMADAFASRIQLESGDDPAAQIDRAFALALQRPPDADERARCLRFRTERSLPELCRALLNLNEFAYRD